MTAYSLPHPTANSQAYTVKLIQKDLFATNPHVLRALKITMVATHDGKAEFASLSGASHVCICALSMCVVFSPNGTRLLIWAIF